MCSSMNNTAAVTSPAPSPVRWRIIRAFRSGLMPQVEPLPSIDDELRAARLRDVAGPLVTARLRADNARRLRRMAAALAIERGVPVQTATDVIVNQLVHSWLLGVQREVQQS